MLIELLLLDQNYLLFPPSLIAASAILLAKFCTHTKQVWNRNVEQRYRYQLTALTDCVNIMQQLHLKLVTQVMEARTPANNSSHQNTSTAVVGAGIVLKAIMMKYGKSVYGSVAHLPYRQGDVINLVRLQSQWTEN